MSNPNFTAIQLSDPSGTAYSVNQMQVLGVLLTSAPTDTLTITGVTQSSGAAQPWTVSTAGWTAAPGSGKAWGNLGFSWSNPGADAGKAFLIVNPL
jgi:hypothetical protein